MADDHPFIDALTIDQLRSALADLPGDLRVAVADHREGDHLYWGTFRPLTDVSAEWAREGDDDGHRYALLVTLIYRSCEHCHRRAPEDARDERSVGWWHDERCPLYVTNAFPRPPEG